MNETEEIWKIRNELEMTINDLGFRLHELDQRLKALEDRNRQGQPDPTIPGPLSDEANEPQWPNLERQLARCDDTQAE